MQINPFVTDVLILEPRKQKLNEFLVLKSLMFVTDRTVNTSKQTVLVNCFISNVISTSTSPVKHQYTNIELTSVVRSILGTIYVT